MDINTLNETWGNSKGEEHTSKESEQSASLDVSTAVQMDILAKTALDH
jgi:hypothetical protein